MSQSKRMTYYVHSAQHIIAVFCVLHNIKQRFVLGLIFQTPTSTNDKIGKLPLFSTLRFVKQVFSFWSFLNYCFQFVSCAYSLTKMMLCFRCLRTIDKISRKKKCCYREKRIAKKFQCIQAFRESFSQSNKVSPDGC